MMRVCIVNPRRKERWLENPATGRPMRFSNRQEAEDEADRLRIRPMHYLVDEEAKDVEAYENALESMALALRPHLGRVVCDDMISEILQTVEDAIQNNMEPG